MIISVLCHDYFYSHCVSGCVSALCPWNIQTVTALSLQGLCRPQLFLRCLHGTFWLLLHSVFRVLCRLWLLCFVSRVLCGLWFVSALCPWNVLIVAAFCLQSVVQAALTGLYSVLERPRVLCGGGCWQTHLAHYVTREVSIQSLVCP